MPASQTSSSPASPALRRLDEFLAARHSSEAVADFQTFEEELHRLVMEVEREVLAEELARYDIDVPAIKVEGVHHRQVVRCEGVYVSRAGEIRVLRSLYRAAGEARSICPLELRAGIIEGYWTPLAAMLAVWCVAHLTAQEAEELLRRVGGMAPSRSSLDRLPKLLSEQWEAQRTRFEESLQVVESVPEAAVTVGVSLDGVMVPMKGGNRQQKRAAARARGKQTRGPAGYREASSGTLTFYDAEGERVGDTRYVGRMPERNKRTLKEMLEDELLAVLDERPDLTVVAVADGARDNWTWLEGAMPEGTIFVLDYFHAAEHLKRALDSAHGEGSTKSRAEFERLRLLLRDDEQGIDKIINAIAYQRRLHPRRKSLATELRYFRLNHSRMRYALFQDQGLPIGSGVVEAANKTLVTVRMKRAGARWSIDGGQAILTFRALAKSHRFDRAWELLAGIYVVPIDSPPASHDPPLRLVA